MTLMRQEIFEQPQVVARMLQGGSQLARPIAEAIRARGIRMICIAARGTSDHAAQYAKYLFEIQNGIPVLLAAPSVYTVYGGAPRLDEHVLTIGISQSGAGPDVCTVVEKARAQGSLTLGITNQSGSRLAQAAEFALVTPAGPEVSVAATKTYTSALATIAQISAALLPDGDASLADLARLPNLMTAVLAAEPNIEASAPAYRDMAECIVLGRGFNYATALEIALKLTETCAVGAKAFSIADFLHGPIAQLDSESVCLLIAPDGPTHAHMQELAGVLSERGASLIVLAHEWEKHDRELLIDLPAGVPEWLSPLVTIIAGQLFANHLSLAKGLSPDTPRGLKKVTMTL